MEKYTSLLNESIKTRQGLGFVVMAEEESGALS